MKRPDFIKVMSIDLETFSDVDIKKSAGKGNNGWNYPENKQEKNSRQYKQITAVFGLV